MARTPNRKAPAPAPSKRPAPPAATPAAEPAGVAQPATAGADVGGRVEKHIDGPGGLHAGVGMQGGVDADVTVGPEGAEGSVSVAADVFGVDAEMSAGAHAGPRGAGFETSNEASVATDEVGAGFSSTSGAGVDVDDGTVVAHTDVRQEGHADVLGAHVEGGAHAAGEIYVGADGGGVDAGYSAETDVFGLEQGSSADLHVGPDGVGVATDTHTQLGDDDLGAGMSHTTDAAIDVGGGRVEVSLSEVREVHADAFGAHVEGGARGEIDAYVDVGARGVDAGLAAESDVFGLETAVRADGHVGADGASTTGTLHLEQGDENLNVSSDATGGAYVDTTSGVEAGAAVGQDVAADVRGFDLGGGVEVAGKVGIGGDGFSTDVESTTSATVGGTDVELSIGTESTVGPEGLSAGTHAGVSGAAGFGGRVEAGIGGVEVGGSIDIAGMHAEGSYGTDDVAHGWNEAQDAAEAAWDSAADAGDDAQEAGENVVDDVGDATGLW